MDNRNGFKIMGDRNAVILMGNRKAVDVPGHAEACPGERKKSERHTQAEAELTLVVLGASDMQEV